MNRIDLALIAAALAVVVVGCESTQQTATKPTAQVAKPVAEAAKPTPKPAPKPVVAAKPAPKPAVAVKPTPKPAAKPVVAAKPTPKPAAKPVVAAKPTPKPAAKPVVAAKPAPKPAAKPVEAAKPTPKTIAPPKPAHVPAPSKGVVAPAPKPAPKPEPAKPLGDIKAKSWGVPGAADPKAWVVQSWHNPATFGEDQGALKVLYEGGQKDKTSVALRVKADLSSRTTLVLDVNNLNTKAVGLSLAVMTTKGDKYFESPMTMIKPGLSKEVAFDLTASNYKTVGSQWKHTARVDGLDSVDYLCLVIYDKEKGSIAFSDMKLLAD